MYPNQSESKQKLQMSLLIQKAKTGQTMLLFVIHAIMSFSYTSA